MPEPRELTEDAVRAYIAARGSRCPYCGDEDLDPACQPTSTDEDDFEQWVKCRACGQEWRDRYVLAGLQPKDVDAPIIPSDYALLEALADITTTGVLMGYRRHHAGRPGGGPDSRETIARFIELAREFERLHAGRQWDGEYMDEIDAFAEAHLQADIDAGTAALYDVTPSRRRPELTLPERDGNLEYTAIPCPKCGRHELSYRTDVLESHSIEGLVDRDGDVCISVAFGDEGEPISEEPWICCLHCEAEFAVPGVDVV